MGIKKLIRESINDFLNEEKGINLKNTIFITYGLGNSFDKDKFAPPVTDTSAFMYDAAGWKNIPVANKESYKHYGNDNYMLCSLGALQRNKPSYGLWAAPLNSEYGWKDFRVKFPDKSQQLTTHFMFKLKRNANIYIIDGLEDIYDLIRPKSKYSDEELKYQLDFTPLIENGYDGVFVTHKAIKELRDDALRNWSVESICIFNKDVIVPYEESPFETAAANDFKDTTNRFNYDDKNGTNDYYGGDYEDEEVDGYYWELANRKKKNQIDRTIELYGNQNVNPDMSKFFKGRHPGILAQMKGNSKDAKMARDFNGTIGSVFKKKG